MADREGGQWNVSRKKNAVYLERVSESGEQLFDASLEPEEASQLAALLAKHADKSRTSDAPESGDEANDSDDEKSDDSDTEDEPSADSDDETEETERS